MKKLRIYLDTSVIGGCLDVEFKEWSNGLLFDFKAGVFTPVISDLLLEEISFAPAKVLKVFEEFMALNPEILTTTVEMADLAELYISRQIVSEKFRDDAQHIAIATVSNADLVVSWNFKHIVHFDKIQRFNAVNIEMGYKPIAIHSPREVTGYGNQSC